MSYVSLSFRVMSFILTLLLFGLSLFLCVLLFILNVLTPISYSIICQPPSPGLRLCGSLRATLVQSGWVGSPVRVPHLLSHRALNHLGLFTCVCINSQYFFTSTSVLMFNSKSIFSFYRSLSSLIWPLKLNLFLVYYF